MAHLSLSLLGPFQVTLGGEPVTGFKSNKVRALLAYLAVEADRPHRREVLAGLLWPDWPDRDALSNLRYALSNLRRVIGDRDAEPPFLLISRDTLQFNKASDYWLDVRAFTEMVEADKTHPSAIDQLEQAVALCRGSFLEGFSVGDSPAFEEWALFTREQIGRQMSSALHRLAAIYEQRGQYEQAQSYAWRQVEMEPWDEAAHRQLMRTLALSGQRGAALAQYETCRRLLAEELGVEPAQETTRLYEQIRDGELKAPVPFPARPPGPPHNLPAPLIPFVGRETELTEIKNRLQDPACRLLTLVGPGGIGKTRLALEAAADQIERFAHGVYFVPLASLQAAETIVPAVAQALTFSLYGESEPQRQLLDYLRQKTMLLIMDNFEHLLDGVGVVTDILKTAPDITILATSRARLNVQGEHLFPVAGMDFPDSEIRKDAPQYSAVRLFLQSARRVQPDFEPAADDLAEVARICRLVQGMPLGILLAATWMRVLTPAEIATEIEQSLDFLETDWQDVPERQRSLRAVFDHSWHLLTEREREVFQGLSTFRGGFTREAAEQVTGASLHELKALVDKSFLHHMPIPSASLRTGPSTDFRTGGRYEMHELLRQYAAEKLEGSPVASEAAHDRHGAYYAGALQQWEADLKGLRQQAALAEVETDSENFRAAWNWAVAQGQVERLDQAMEGLAWFYWWRGRYPEGETVFQATAKKLAVASDLSPAASWGSVPLGYRLRVWARALAWQSYYCRTLGRRELAAQLQQQSLALFERPELADQDTRRERALLFRHMGHTVMMFDYEQARELFEQSLALYGELDDGWGTAEALSFLGDVAHLQGAYGEARQLHEECLVISQALGDQVGIAWEMARLALIAMRQGRFEEAERLARESRARSQKLGYRETTAHGLLVLGETLEPLAKFAEARSLLEECLAIFDDLGRRGWATSAHAVLGSVYLHLGQYEQAHAHAQTGLALARETGTRFRIGHTLLLLGSVALAEEAYAEAQRLLRESVAVYQEIGQQADVTWALAVSSYAARGLGQLAQAKEHLCKALRMVAEIQVPMLLVYALPAIALLLADQGELEQAVELYALASRYPLVADSRWFEDVAGRRVGAVAASLPPDVVAAAQGRGQSRDLEATVAELLVELGE
jgi:predicted ATPase/DNA-binding SARP family transcriptional activator